MMRRINVLKATAGALVAMVGLTGCSVFDVPLPGGVDTGANPISVHVMFRDVLDLVPQTTVKVNDVSVGRVTHIELKHDVADVTLSLPHNVDVPSNATATIRQTSLLGEKFVSLQTPADPSGTKLANGAVIGLDRTGRNPEVEEVLGALGALLSGGGVGQLKLITEELNKATVGREQDVRSVFDQLNTFMGQLAQNKDQIVAAITNLDRLSVQLNQQDATIKLALDNLPTALASIDKQRADLVKMLAALDNLSGVGVKVIQASKQTAITSFQELVPILSQLAAAGDSFPKSISMFLNPTFPDSLIGTTPDAARKFQMGDYLNLSARLDLNLATATVPGLPGMTVGGVLQLCQTTPLAPLCQQGVPLVNTLCSGPLATTPLCSVPGANGGSGTTGGTAPGGSAPGGTAPGGAAPGGGTPNPLGGLGVPGGLGQLLRPAPHGAMFTGPTPTDQFGFGPMGYDPGLGTLLFQGALS